MMLDSMTPVLQFTALDRCDACGAQAYSSASREDASAELLFCLHHRKKHIDALLLDGWTVTDDTYAIENLAGNAYVNI